MIGNHKLQTLLMILYIRISLSLISPCLIWVALGLNGCLELFYSNICIICSHLIMSSKGLTSQGLSYCRRSKLYSKEIKDCINSMESKPLSKLCQMEDLLLFLLDFITELKFSQPNIIQEWQAISCWEEGTILQKWSISSTNREM